MKLFFSFFLAISTLSLSAQVSPTFDVFQNGEGCNTTNDCDDPCDLDCRNDDENCTEVVVTLTGAQSLCGGMVNFGLVFPPNLQQYICSFTRLSNNSWLVDFNTTAFFCDTGMGGIINIPVRAVGFCLTGSGPFDDSNTINGFIRIDIC